MQSTSLTNDTFFEQDITELNPPFSFDCPFCHHPTTINRDDFSSDRHLLRIDNKQGRKELVTYFIVCPNPECKDLTLIEDIHEAELTKQGGGWVTGKIEKRWRVIPPSSAQVMPSYVPNQIVDDYYDACQIQELSPKAAATLARRCLQGMIRDFWNIRKDRLIEEINDLEQKIDPLTWRAIDATRKIGNIGAHMEKDVNLIINVEPKEAALLINLIATLIRDWYITRHERESRLTAIVEISDKKKRPADTEWSKFT